MKKRPLTLTAGILGTVFSALYVAGIAYLLALTGLFASFAPELLFALVLTFFLPLAFSIVTLVLNACSISGFGATHEKYAKKRGTIIAAIVFNLLLVLLLVYGLVTGGALDTLTFAVDVAVLVIMVAVSVFYIVDLCLEKKRVASAPVAPAAENNENTNVQ